MNLDLAKLKCYISNLFFFLKQNPSCGYSTVPSKEVLLNTHIKCFVFLISPCVLSEKQENNFLTVKFWLSGILS